MAHILIMEDDYDQAYLLAEFLKGRGYEVSTTDSGQKALDALIAEKHDLLITDIFVRRDGEMIPDGGLLLISRLRFPGNRGDMAWLRKLPIIAITGGANLPGQTKLLDTLNDFGADKSFSKPLELRKLGDAVKELLTPS